jgi:hypothetical protein
MARRSDRWLWPAVFLILCGAYLLFVGSVSTSEALAAILAVVAGLCIAILHHQNATRALDVRAPWRRLAFAVPVALVRDTIGVGGALLRALFSGVNSKISVQPFDPGGANGRDAGRRAAVILATSLAPNAYVIRVTQDALLMHQLVPVADRADEAWPL